MARDHTRVNLDIWGDEEFLDLPVDAQALYWRLWTSPARSYCGTHEWHPGRLTQSASDWTVDRLRRAAAVLSERLFLIVDEVTEECLLRSWIKHDGLWKTPNMAVTMAAARAAVGSKVLRGVIVHEVAKIRDAHPELSGWKRDEVVKMLAQRAIDPASIPAFNPGANPTPNPAPDLDPNPPANPSAKGYGHPADNPPSNPAPTTATATSYFTTATSSGGLRTELTTAREDEPTPCKSHPNGTTAPCRACGARRQWAERRAAELAADELNARRQARELAENCPTCHGTNWIPDTDPAVRCTHGDAEAVS